MEIALIAAMSENGVIGSQNKLPWHLPEELKYFQKVTSGKPVVMGRKTFESIGSKPLPNRLNIILSRSSNFVAPKCLVVATPEEAVAAAGECEELMIIGGANIYQLFLPIATRLYLTKVHQTVAGDTYFPSINWQEWRLISEQVGDGFTAKIWDRKKGH